MVLGKQVTALVGSALHQTIIRDISPDGASLEMSRRVEPDQMVLAPLFNRISQQWQINAMRVLHATPQNDGAWLIGCSFLRRFTAEEFRAVTGSGITRPMKLPRLG